MNIHKDHSKRERTLRYNISELLKDVNIISVNIKKDGCVAIGLNPNDLDITYEDFRLIAELFQTENIRLCADNNYESMYDFDEEPQQDITIFVENIPNDVLDMLC